MFSRFTILAVILTIAQATSPMIGQAPNSPTADHQKQNNNADERGSPTNKAASVNAQKPASDSNQAHPKNDASDKQHSRIMICELASVSWPWHERIAWGGNLLLAAVGLCTFIAVWRQTSYLITSQRAWMVAVPDSPKVPDSNQQMSLSPISLTVIWHFINKGKTPAYLLEIGTGALVLPSTESLPRVPPVCEDIEKWGKRGIPLLPKSEKTRSHYRVNVPKAISLRTGDLNLWVYGYIKYRDTFRRKHITRFCYRWEPVNDAGVASFTADGPAEYNQAS